MLGVHDVVSSSGPSRLVHLTSHSAFQLFNDSLTYPRAESFCRGQLSSLMDRSEDGPGALELLRQSGLHSPVWIRDLGKASKSDSASKHRE